MFELNEIVYHEEHGECRIIGIETHSPDFKPKYHVATRMGGVFATYEQLSKSAESIFYSEDKVLNILKESLSGIIPTFISKRILKKAERILEK